MSDDGKLKDLVLDELRWDTRVDEAHIGVAAEDGAITLNGHVSTYPEKYATTKAVSRVQGVKSIVDHIEVNTRHSGPRDDTEIAKRIAHVLDWNVSIPDSDVKAIVQNGIVTMTGTVDHYHQREHVEKHVRHVRGVKGLLNHIETKAEPSRTQIREDIQNALHRHAKMEANGVKVDVVGHTVTLSGHVKTMVDRDLIRRAVWATSGVQAVIDNIRIH